jgi:hypothetical protein
MGRRHYEASAQRLRKRRIADNGEVEKINPVAVFERDGWNCYLCSTPVNRNAPHRAPDEPTVDHVQAISKGGGHTWGNVRCAHRQCNTAKNGTDRTTGFTPPPHSSTWHPRPRLNRPPLPRVSCQRCGVEFCRRGAGGAFCSSVCQYEALRVASGSPDPAKCRECGGSLPTKEPGTGRRVSYCEPCRVIRKRAAKADARVREKSYQRMKPSDPRWVAWRESVENRRCKRCDVALEYAGPAAGRPAVYCAVCSAAADQERQAAWNERQKLLRGQGGTQSETSGRQVA